MDAELRQILDPQQMERMEALRTERRASVQAGGTRGERRNGRADETRYREGVDARGI